MTDYSILERRICQNLNLKKRPVSIAFRETAPAGISRFAGSEPSGCSFWKLAAGGMTFYTVPEDHCNCAMGSFTHRFPVSPERAGDLEHTISMMSSSGYLKMEELASLPRLIEAPKAVIYAPLGDTPVDPDLVVIVAQPMQVMLLQESALRAGVGIRLSLLGGPTCLSLPSALGTRGMITSAGCLGNRVYNDLGDDELYVVSAGRAFPQIVEEMQAIAQSAAKRMESHRGHRRSTGTIVE